MSRIIIFEGVDGTGKTTIAKRCALQLGARYVHFSHEPGVKNIGRLFLEAALPALLGYQDVVFDRCWLSEMPYAVAYHEGADRLGPEVKRMLERIFMRCATTVVMCDPGWDEVVKNFIRDEADEMVDNLAQMKSIYELYKTQQTSLPCVTYNYLVHQGLKWDQLPQTTEHHLTNETAGSMDAKILIVGESYANLTDADSLYQKPFCSFSGAGCSKWLTRELDQAGIGEERLFWCNADHLEDDVAYDKTRFTRVIALGVIAASRCRELGFENITELEHPQSHKRFKHNQHYPIREAAC